jgi:radical SAM superfamily enzyme YgiQ (UPF0313 family)
MTLAAYTPSDVDIRIIDENVEPIQFSDMPDLVGITTLTATARRAYEIADTYRGLGTKVVLGGIHASMIPEEALKHADSVVVGEAENIWETVLSDAASGGLEKIYRNEGFIDYARPRFPRRDLIHPKRYWIANGVQTSRGCPHNCNFCSVSLFTGRKPRMREVDNVLEEVDALPPSKIASKKIVAFLDDNVAAKPSRAKELFKALKPMNILWGSQACITFAYDEELLGLAVESGCRFLLIGLETLSSRTLEDIGKRQNSIERYEEALRNLRKSGILVLGAFMFGFDSDDELAFSDTLRFALRNKLPLAQFSVLTPYPGTRVYSQLRHENRLEERYWFDPSWMSRMVFKPKGMSAQQVLDRYHQISRDFYSYPSIIKRFPIHFLWRYWLLANLLFRQAAHERYLDRPTPSFAKA